VENVAHGHICAEKALADEARAKKAAGQVATGEYISFLAIVVSI
jgi:hypothetical protein